MARRILKGLLGSRWSRSYIKKNSLKMEVSKSVTLILSRFHNLTFVITYINFELVMSVNLFVYFQASLFNLFYMEFS